MGPRGLGLFLLFSIIFLVVPAYAGTEWLEGFTKDDCSCSIPGLEFKAGGMLGSDEFWCEWEDKGSSNPPSVHVTIWKYSARSDVIQHMKRNTERYVDGGVPKTFMKPVSLEKIEREDYFSYIYDSGGKKFGVEGDRGLLYGDNYYIHITGTKFTGSSEAQNALARAEACMKRAIDKGEPAPEAKSLHGTVIATHHPYGTPRPLNYAEVDLMADGKPVQITRTDAAGKYNFSYPLQKGKEYRIDVVLVYATPEKYYFEIRDAERKKITERDQGKLVEFSHVFTYSGDADLEQDIDLENFDEDFSPEKLRELGFSGPDIYPVNTEGLMYVQMTEVLEYYRNVLKEDPRHDLPVVVYMWADDHSANYRKDSGIIVIGQRVSLLGSSHTTIPRQRHTVYHEFSHYMMEDIYGKMPDRVSDNNALEINHGGYTNPRTSDSWMEGFAEFMPVVISDYYGNNQCGIYADRENLDADNTQAWGMWNAEEYAAAEVLWDLYDNPEQMKACDYRMRTELQKVSASPATDDATKNNYARIIAASQARETSRGYADDDPGSIPWSGLWPVIRTYHSNIASVYTALVMKYPDNKAFIDSLFVNHGFFHHTNEGNKAYDFGEPFRDSNGDRIRQGGEYFVDLPADRSFRDTYTVGTASNYQRPQRRSTMDMPGHYIRVNNAVPFYTYTAEYPGTGYLPYLSTVENIDGSIYVQVPRNPDAKFTVIAHGVTTGNPLVFTSMEFNNQYENSLKQGYYTSHDFRVSGPIPTAPGRSDYQSGGSSGTKNMDLLAAKGPVFDLLTEKITSRVPLFISVPIIIGAVLVLVYMLKKR